MSNCEQRLCAAQAVSAGQVGQRATCPAGLWDVGGFGMAGVAGEAGVIPGPSDEDQNEQPGVHSMK
jgi:hypothetical protein